MKDRIDALRYSINLYEEIMIHAQSEIRTADHHGEEMREHYHKALEKKIELQSKLINLLEEEKKR